MSSLATAARQNARYPFALAHTSQSAQSKQIIIRAKSSTSFVKPSKDSNAFNPVKREKAIGAFRSLPPSQLTHPVLQGLQGYMGDIEGPVNVDNAEFTDKTGVISISESPLLRKGMVTPKSLGSTMLFPDDKNSLMAAYGIPRNVLIDFRLLPKPCSIIRASTLDLSEKLNKAKDESSLNTRLVLTATSGTGKSYLMLQAITYCASSDWIVLYIPRANNLVDSSTSYAYDARTQLYQQHSAAYQILHRFQKVNLSALSSLRSQTRFQIDKRPPILEGTSLKDFIDVGINDQSIASFILAAVLEELGKQTRYPFLLAVDDFQSLYCRTSYRDPHFSTIKPYHLSMPRLIMEYASGKKAFARGAFLGALSLRNTQFPVPLELREALRFPLDRPVSPYVKRSEALVEYTQGLQSLPIPEKLTVNDAIPLFELWKKSLALHTRPNDELFLSKYSESGGNAGAFVQGGLLSALVT